MTWSWENPAEGYMLSTLMDPWLLYPIIAGLKGSRYPLYWPRWNNILGVMIKLKDEVSGGVFPNGRISKPLTASDRERLGVAEEVCHKILIEARGADPTPIFMTPLRGTHPERHGSHRHDAGHGPADRSHRASTSATPASSRRRWTGRPC